MLNTCDEPLLRENPTVSINLNKIVPLKVKYKYKDNYDKLFQYCEVLNVYDKVNLAIVSECLEKVQYLEKEKRLSILRILPSNRTFKLPNYNKVYDSRMWAFVLLDVLNRVQKGLVQRLEQTNKRVCTRLIRRYLTRE